MTARESVQLVIWDFDGTIADTRPAILGSVAAAMDEIGLSGTDVALAVASIGLPLATMFERLAPRAGPGDIDAMVSAYRRDFDRTAASRTVLFAGIAALLEDLRIADVRCTIATSRRRQSLVPLLEHLQVADHFPLAFADDDVVAPKPDPEMTRTACAAHQVPPEEALVIGDTAFDIEMGRRAGTTTCAVTWGNHSEEELRAAEPDHVVHTPAELMTVLSHLLP